MNVSQGCQVGVQGQICDILTQANYESFPAPSGHTDSHFLDTYIWGGGGGGGGENKNLKV
jgi:hypothetical protein